MGAVEKLRASSSASSFRPFSAVRERRPSVGILDMIPEVDIHTHKYAYIHTIRMHTYIYAFNSEN